MPGSVGDKTTEYKRIREGGEKMSQECVTAQEGLQGPHTHRNF